MHAANLPMSGLFNQRHTAFLPVLAALLACAPDAPAPPVTLFRDSAGITIAESRHDRPTWDSPTAWRLSLEPVVRIGRIDDAEPGALLDQVRHARRLPNGMIAVASDGPDDVRIFDGDGRHVRTIGRRGEGPGEFREPWYVHELPGDSLLVIDLSGRIAVFDSTGAWARSFRVRLPGRDLQALEPVGMLGNGTLLYRAHHLEDPQWSGTVRTRMRLLRFDLEGALLGSLGDYPNQTISITPQYRGPVLYGPWASSAPADSTFWYGPGDRFQLREIDPDGTVRRQLRLDLPVWPVTEAEVAAFFQEIRERLQGTGREQAFERTFGEMTVAEVKPAHGELMTDAVGNLWVQEYDLEGSPSPSRWHVFDPGGTYLGVIVMPPRFTVYQIGTNFVLGHWTDELDVEYVVMYGLEKPTHGG